MSGSSTAVGPNPHMATRSQEPLRLECPFCQFHDESEYVLLLHIEALHTDDSPFVVKDDPANTGLRSGGLSLGPGKFSALDYEFGPTHDDEETTYVLCPEPGCEEPVLLIELQTHLDFHDAEQISMEDVRGDGGNASSGSSSGGSNGNSPWREGEGRGVEMVVGRLVESVESFEREWRSGEREGRERDDGGSRSSSVRREKREGRTLMISRDGTISRESVVLKDSHKGRDRDHKDRDHKDRDGQRERDRMLEREREKERERNRGRENDRGRDSRGHRVAYVDPGSSSAASTASSRHLQKSPKRSYRAAFTRALLPDEASISSRGHEKSSARPNAVTPYKDNGVKRLGVCEVAFPLLSYFIDLILINLTASIGII